MTSGDADDGASVDAQLAALQRDYIVGLSERIQPVLVLWQQYLDSACVPELLSDVYRKLHAIAGTSSILNVKPIDSLSNQAQVKIQSLMQGANIDTVQIAEIGQLLNELLDAAKSGDVNAPPINLNG